jgi:hypothetical protein
LHLVGAHVSAVLLVGQDHRTLDRRWALDRLAAHWPCVGPGPDTAGWRLQHAETAIGLQAQALSSTAGLPSPDALSLADTVSKIDRLSDEQRECHENCEEASAVCEWCAAECLGDADREECVRFCRDVADLTSLHARFLARDSAYSADLTAICADACEVCADECCQQAADHCRLCAEALSECAETCRQMAG